MKRGRSTRLPRGQRVLPARAWSTTLGDTDCLEAIAYVAARPRVPSLRIAAARDVAVMVLVARLNLSCHWLARLSWGDIRDVPVRSIQLAEGGLTCWVLLDDATVEVVRGWRARLERWSGRAVAEADPLFPAFGHARKRDGSKRLTDHFFMQIVRRRLGEAGIPPDLCSISHLGGALIGESTSELSQADGGPAAACGGLVACSFATGRAEGSSVSRSRVPTGPRRIA